jgi:hypothetical protein
MFNRSMIYSATDMYVGKVLNYVKPIDALLHLVVSLDN